MNLSNKVEAMFDRLREKASDNDVKRIDRELPRMRRGSLQKVWGEVLLLWRAASDKDAPWYSKASAIAGLLYVIIPFDVLPDFIPFLGLSDDVAAVTLAVSYLGIALNKYKKNRKKVKPTDRN